MEGRVRSKASEGTGDQRRWPFWRSQNSKKIMLKPKITQSRAMRWARG